jgi:tRNA pseudouridine38-40 synthase
VQQTVEEALGVLLRAPVALTVAGRTDAGVHATGQVAHAELAAVPDLRRLNGILPPDVRVQAITEVPAEFDARFSALARHYAYRLDDGVPDPLRRHDTVAWPRPLDVDAMHAAAQKLLGENDFAAFCRKREGATTIRTLRYLDVVRADVIVARVGADAFCHSMVRSLIGALVAVGEGRRGAGWPGSLLTEGERSSAITVAPARGLTLVRVDYPVGADALAARQQESRRRRG